MACGGGLVILLLVFSSTFWSLREDVPSLSRDLHSGAHQPHPISLPCSFQEHSFWRMLWRICSTAFYHFKTAGSLGPGDFEQHRTVWLVERGTFVAPVAGPVQGCASSFVQAVHPHSVVQALPQPAQVAWKNFTLIKKHKKRAFILCFAFKSISSVVSSHLWWIHQQTLKTRPAR